LQLRVVEFAARDPQTIDLREGNLALLQGIADPAALVKEPVGIVRFGECDGLDRPRPSGVTQR
jgi:hypothetical protein